MDTTQIIETERGKFRLRVKTRKTILSAAWWSVSVLKSSVVSKSTYWYELAQDTSMSRDAAERDGTAALQRWSEMYQEAQG